MVQNLLPSRLLANCMNIKIQRNIILFFSLRGCKIRSLIFKAGKRATDFRHLCTEKDIWASEGGSSIKL